MVCGALASLIAPWVHWGIEKRRKRSEHRISLVKSWEAMIARVFKKTSQQPLNYTGPSPAGAALLGEPEFSSLKPYLSSETLESLFKLHLIEANVNWAEPVWLQRIQKDIQAAKTHWGVE